MAILDCRHPAKSGRSSPKLHRYKAVLSPVALTCSVTGEPSEGGLPHGKKRKDLLKQEQLSSHNAALRQEFS